MMIAVISSVRRAKGEIVQLVIKREQAPVKSLLGGHKGMEFTLAYWLVLSDEECALAEQYKLGDYAVTWKNLASGRVPDDTIRNMMAGRSQTLTDVTTLVANEREIKKACDSLPKLFEIVRSFGGQEVIDYPRDSGS
jgi:hypothetical protein